MKRTNITSKEFQEILKKVDIDTYDDVLFRLASAFKNMREECKESGSTFLADLYLERFETVFDFLWNKGYYEK